jgi:hypothetical protein
MQFESHLGHVFSLFRGSWAAECVQISFMGPCGGPFLLVATGLAAPSLGLDSGVAVYSFMAGSAGNCMTCRCLSSGAGAVRKSKMAPPVSSVPDGGLSFTTGSVPSC